MENIKSIEARLWEMANKLRGSMDASEYKNYILGFLFYMFLSKKQEKFLVDEQLLEVEPGQTPNQAYLEVGEDPEVLDEYIAELVSSLGYAILPQNTWATLVEKIANGQVIASDYQALFDAFNKSTQENKEAEKDFKGIFNDMNLGDSRLGTTTVDRARALGKIVDLVNEVSLDTDSDEDVLGHIYEYLIGQFAANAGKKGGEYYTPHEVSQIMARIVTDGVHLKDESFTVYDPACGSGSLLLTVGSYLEHSNKKGAIKYYGQELNTTTYNIARMNLLMHDVDYQDMKMSNKDTLREDWPDGKNAIGIDEPRSFDAVVANPPYSAKWSAEETLMRDPRFKDFGKLAPKSKADYAFLLHGLYHLNSTGTMAIVLPHGVLFRGAAEETIRKTLIDRNLIDSVIGLPANLFYGASIPTIIMVLKRNKTDRNILIIDASKYFKKAKNKNILTEEDIDRIVKAYRERKAIDKFARVVPFSEIQENDYNLNIPRYVDTSEEEPEIDLKEVLDRIKKDDEEIAELSKKLNDQLRILGVINEDINL